jgi:alpha-mannosidase
MVYEDAEKLYAEVRKSGEALLDEAFDVLLGTSNSVLTPSTNFKALPSNTKIVGYNTTFLQRYDIVEVPLAGASAELKSHVLQTSLDGKTGYAVMHCEGGGSIGAWSSPDTGLHSSIMPASGVLLCLVLSPSGLMVWQCIQMAQTTSHCGMQACSLQFRKGGLRACMMLNWGEIFSRVDLSPLLMLFLSRELIAEGSTGGLVIFEDRPGYWDAWGED